MGMDIPKHIKEHAVLGPFALAAGLAAHLADLANPHQVTAAQLGLTAPMDYKGAIGLPADFPTLAAVNNGDFYTITANVTDNDATRTNTGQNFSQYDEIVWNGATWDNLGNSGGVVANTWFVAKSGADTNNGMTPGSAFLTIGAAIAASSAGECIKVYCGEYTEDLTIKAGIYIDARNCMITGSHTIEAAAALYVYNLVASGGDCITGEGNVFCDHIALATGSDDLFVTSGGSLNIDCSYMVCEDGIALNNADGNGITATYEGIYISGTGIAMNSDAGTTYAKGGWITDDGSGTALAGDNVAKFYCSCTRINCATVWDIDATSILKIDAPEITGTRTEAAGSIVVANSWSRREVDVASYDTVPTDNVLGVTRTATGACAIELQTADMWPGRKIEIVDEGGNAGTNNITVSTEGAETIAGQDTLVIDDDYNVVCLYSDGSNWFVG